jgi:hypothetical protein
MFKIYIYAVKKKICLLMRVSFSFLKIIILYYVWLSKKKLKTKL